MSKAKTNSEPLIHMVWMKKMEIVKLAILCMINESSVETHIT